MHSAVQAGIVVSQVPENVSLEFLSARLIRSAVAAASL
jgi:hypothetical protein